MSDRVSLSLPSLDPEKARDIGRGHMALAEQYRLGEREEMAREHERLARLWLRYAHTLAVVGQPKPDA